MTGTDAKQKLDEAQKMISGNLLVCCEEIIDMKNTGILKDGKVREIAKICDFVGGGHGNALSLVESLINKTALEAVVSSCDKKRTTNP